MKNLNTLWKVLVMSGLLLFANLVFAAPVNVNTADAESLAENIKGIGPKKAQAIINYRKHNGAFRSHEDLIKVKGIGLKLIEKNKANILFSDASSKTAKSKSAKN